MSLQRFCLSLSIVALSASAVNAQEQLSWKFRKGEELRYSVIQNMKTSRKVGDQDISSAIGQAMDMRWSVKDVAANGSTVMHQTVDRIQLKMEGGPAGTLEFDTNDSSNSENPFVARMSQVFGNIVKQPFQVSMTPTGQVSDVVVPKALLAAIRQGAAGNTGALSEDTLKDMMKQSAVTLPPQAVGPGSKWTNTQEVQLAFGKMTVNSEMTYVNRNDAGDIMIDVVPGITVKPAEGATSQDDTEQCIGSWASTLQQPDRTSGSVTAGPDVVDDNDDRRTIVRSDCPANNGDEARKIEHPSSGNILLISGRRHTGAHQSVCANVR